MQSAERVTGTPGLPGGAPIEAAVKGLAGMDDRAETAAGPGMSQAALVGAFQHWAEQVAAGTTQVPIGMDAALSRAVVLMMKSPEHAQIPIADLEYLLLPPIMLQQFKLYSSGLVPVAFAAWGLFSEEVERRFLAGDRKLSAADWKSGDRAHLVHLVAPFGGEAAVIEDLKRTLRFEKSSIVDCRMFEGEL